MNLDLRIKNIIAPLLLVTSFLLLAAPVGAQTIDPNTWQQNAVGLKTTSNSLNKTAGLTIGVGLANQTSWPYLTLHGGVREGWNRLWAGTGIDLGNIKIPTTSAASNTETANWSSDVISINSGALRVHASRLSPAILTQTTANGLRLFSGNVRHFGFNGSVVTNGASTPSYPKYVAYSSGGTVQVSQLSGTATNLPALDNNWLLVWYGNNSHFVDTKKPVSYSFGQDPYPGSDITVPMNQAFLADVPMLLTFENNPTSIMHSAEGGIDLAFGSAGGYTTILPLFGRDYLSASVTDGWNSSANFPTSARDKITFWTQRLCQFPTNIAESYGYNDTTDVTTITETVTFTPVCSFSNARFAPIPPMLGIARSAFGASLSFSGTVVDGGLPTSFGPTLGIENVNSYSWSMSGMKKYSDSKRILGNTAVPAVLTQELNSYVDRITAASHFAPWAFTDGLANTSQVGRIYFDNPADTIYHLSEAAAILPEPQKTNLVNYIRQERTNFPPESTYNIAFTNGTTRDFFAHNPNVGQYGQSFTQIWNAGRSDSALRKLPVYNFLSLSRYYDLTGDTIPASVGTGALTALNNDMAEQDWASMYWFDGYDFKHAVVENLNRHFAGMVGVVDIYRRTGNTASEAIARGLLTKAAVARIGAAQYPKYLYSANIENITGYSADWMATQTAGVWYGSIFNYNWTQPGDDHRQLTRLDQFGTLLYDHSGYGHWFQDISSSNLSAFTDITPELGRLLNDFAKAESLNYISKVEQLIPHWHISFGEAVLGAEHGMSYPTDAYQIFMAKSLIQGESPSFLEGRLDIPWLTNGDFFYVNKAAEVVKAYKGWSWSDQVSPSPTPAPVVGDLNGDSRVGIGDLSIFLSNWGTTSSTGDLDGNGSVGIGDLSIFLSNWTG